VHGPYGVAIYDRNSSNRPDEEYHQGVNQLHPFIKSLPGFLSVTYYNVDELDYHFVIAFSDEPSTDNAVEKLRNIMSSVAPDAKISKAEVVPGELVDKILASEIHN
jgi:hypothetical protein